ncbi:MAG: tetratricopeptide repeat protein, partial [Persicimonas sp.]
RPALLGTLAVLAFCVSACSSTQKTQRPADTRQVSSDEAAATEDEPASEAEPAPEDEQTSEAEPDDGGAKQACRAWVLYGYDGQNLRDSLVPPEYGWVEIQIGDEVTSRPGEGLWFWRGDRIEHLDYVTRRVIEEDGSHERSHRLVHTPLEGESTVLYDEPVKEDGYGDKRTAAGWATKNHRETYSPTYWYRGPRFEVVSINDRRVDLYLYDGNKIEDAERAVFNFEGNAVEVADQKAPSWEDVTPPVDVAAAPDECGEVRVIDGQIHAHSGDSEEAVSIERLGSSDPINELIAVQWLPDGVEPPLEEMEEATNARQAKSDSLLAEAREAADDGKTERARELLSEALLTDGDNIEVLFEFGTLALEDGHLAAAQHALVAAYDFTENRTGIKDFQGRLLHNLGRLAEAQNDGEGAKEMYERSLQKRPDDEVKKRLEAID